MKILAIDTSCDDTSSAVVVDDRVASNIIMSQDEIHKNYGGIVPEIAARTHFLHIAEAVKRALFVSGNTFKDIDKIAVTKGPGLIGSLLVGVSYAKGAAYRFNKKLVGVNHLEGHLYAPFIGKVVEYPFIALVVSGGHTALYKVLNSNDIQIIGRTLDDAAGECLDKTARLWHLGYPGGKAIDIISRAGNPKRFKFPRIAFLHGNFSFSGLKTAAIRFGAENPDAVKNDLADVASSFLEAVVDTLILHCIKACRKENIDRLAVSGGVSANKRLREKLKQTCVGERIELIFPDIEFTTDNAAMIGYTAFLKGESESFDMDAISSIAL